MRLKVAFLLCTAPLLLAAADVPAPVNPSAQKIADIEKALKNNSSSPEPHVDLAAEYCRRARDGEDLNYYDKASAEVESALKIAPDNFDARKLKVTILLGENRFDAALKMAAELNHKIPDDIALWGLLSEINTALGNYEEAVRDAQWVLNIRPGSLLGFTEAARLREAYGDAEGAIEFYEEARRRTALGDAEERAWLLVQIARLTAQTGGLKHAGELFSQALAMNPQSQLAIGGLANLRIMEGNYSEAVSLFEKRYEAVHDARSLYDLAGALEKAGRKDEAAIAFREFETKALAETEHPHNANIELIEYYLERESKPAEALAIARRERAVRHDSRTMASLAWAECRASRVATCKLEPSLPTVQEAKK
jgi:tetratricopeptide (TPR) repeat protein